MDNQNQAQTSTEQAPMQATQAQNIKPQETEEEKNAKVLCLLSIAFRVCGYLASAIIVSPMMNQPMTAVGMQATEIIAPTALGILVSWVLAIIARVKNKTAKFPKTLIIIYIILAVIDIVGVALGLLVIFSIAAYCSGLSV